MLTDIGRQSMTGDATDTRAHDLDADHQWRRKQHAPKHAVAVLCAGLRIGGDALRIVVRRAGDQAGAELFE